MGWNCALKGAPTAVFGRAAFLCRFKFFSLFSYSIYIEILKGKKKNQSVKQPYSDSASSNTIVLCNSGSVCNAMHWEYTKKPKLWHVQDNAAYKSDVRLLLCLTTLYLLVLKLHLKLIKVSFLSLCGCFIEVFWVWKQSAKMFGL